jgi:hypothetical protein
MRRLPFASMSAEDQIFGSISTPRPGANLSDPLALGRPLDNPEDRRLRFARGRISAKGAALLQGACFPTCR